MRDGMRWRMGLDEGWRTGWDRVGWDAMEDETGWDRAGRDEREWDVTEDGMGGCMGLPSTVHSLTHCPATTWR